MIVRARVELRLKGGRREAVRATLAEGLARLVVTGSFHGYVEEEALGAEEMAERTARAVEALVAWGAGEAWARRAGPAKSGTETGIGTGTGTATGTGTRTSWGRGEAVELVRGGALEGWPVTVSVRARQRHPRGRAAVAIEVVAVPVPPGMGRSGADAVREARRFVDDRSGCERALATAAHAVDGLAGRIAGAALEALSGGQATYEVETGVAAGWRNEHVAGLPLEAVAWLDAVSRYALAEGVALAELPPAGDGGGLLDAAPGVDGGGLLDDGGGAHGAFDAGDAGGGTLGGA